MLVAEVDSAFLVHADAVDGTRLGAIGPEGPRGLQGVVERDRWEVVPGADESVGMREGERPYEDGVDHREDRDRGAERGDEGDDGGEREGGGPA